VKRPGLWNLPTEIRTCAGVAIDPAAISLLITGPAWQAISDYLGSSAASAHHAGSHMIAALHPVSVAVRHGDHDQLQIVPAVAPRERDDESELTPSRGGNGQRGAGYQVGQRISNDCFMSQGSVAL
jgi:hypothetical protein